MVQSGRAATNSCGSLEWRAIERRQRVVQALGFSRRELEIPYSFALPRCFTLRSSATLLSQADTRSTMTRRARLFAYPGCLVVRESRALRRPFVFCET